MSEHETASSGPPSGTPENGGPTNTAQSMLEKLRSRRVELDAPGTSLDIIPPPNALAVPPVVPAPALNRTINERADELQRIAAATAVRNGSPVPTSPSNGNGGERSLFRRFVGGVFGNNGGDGGGGNDGPPPNTPENPINPDDHERIERLDKKGVVDRIIELHTLSYVERDQHNAELELLFSRFKRFGVYDRVLEQSPATTKAKDALAAFVTRTSIDLQTQQLLGPLVNHQVQLKKIDHYLDEVNKQINSPDTKPKLLPLLKERKRQLEERKPQVNAMLEQEYLAFHDANGVERPGVREFVGLSGDVEVALIDTEEKELRKIEGGIKRDIKVRLREAMPNRPVDQPPFVNGYMLPPDELMPVDNRDQFDRIIDSLPGVSKVSDDLKAQMAKPPAERDNQLVEQSKQLLEWYSYQAQRFGLFGDIDDNLTTRYVEVRNEVLSGKFSTKEIAEFPKEARDYADAVEDELFWDSLQGSGIASETMNAKFKGIRQTHARSAYKQILTQIQYLKRGAIQNVGRGSGDWNINYEDEVIRVKEDVAGEFKRNYDDDGYRVILSTTSKENYVSGIRQYLDHITNGSGKFDANEIIQSMGKLGQAIEMYGQDFYDPDGLKEMRNSVEVELYMFTAQFFASIGQTDIYAQLMDRMADTEGLERMKLVPQLYDGLTGLAVYFLEKDKQFDLYFRPEGHRGQIAESIDAQKYMREEMKDRLAKKVSNYELKDYFEGEDRNQLSEEERETRREYYRKQLIKNVNDPDYLNKHFMERQPSSSEKANKESDDKATKAVKVATQYFDVFGQTARMGAPSWAANRKYQTQITDSRNPNKLVPMTRDGQAVGEKIETRKIIDSGDFIRVDDAVYFLKYAVLQAQTHSSEGHGGGRTVANIRKDGAKIPRTHDEAHHYYDGLDHHEKHAFDEAVAELKKNGFKAKINGKTFEEIINLPEVKQMQNNFVGIDDDIRTRLATDIVIGTDDPKAEWFKHAKNILDSRGVLFGSKNRTSELDEYVQAVENSRNFHTTIQRMLYREIAVDRDKLDYGLGNMPLVIKRSQYMPLYYMANIRERVSRAETLIPELPTYFSSFAEEIGARNMLEVVSLIDLKAFDVYEIQRHLMRIKTVNRMKKLFEGDIGENGERVWGLFEKPVSTATQLWNIFYHEPGSHSIPTKDHNEKIVVNAMNLFKTFGQIGTQIEKLLTNDKGAGASGAGREEIAKFWSSYLFKWLYSHDTGNKRTQGGLDAYKAAEDGWHELEHHKFDPHDPDSESVLWEIFRRLETSHDPVLVDNSQKVAV